MIPIISSLLPIFVLIALGYVFATYHFPDARFWVGAERLTYYALLPPLLIQHLARVKVVAPVLAPMAGVAAVTIFLVCLLLLFLRQRIAAGGPAFSSVFQGSIRFNAYIGIAAAASLYPNDGVALASILLVILVPILNVLSVTVLAHIGQADGQKPKPSKIARSVIQNPLILGCIGGMALRVTGIGMPALLNTALTPLTAAALPLGLLVVGSGFDLKMISAGGTLVVVASLIKLVVSPVIATAVCLALGLHGTAAAVLVLFSALPAASSSYILAGQMGGDRSLMAAILAVQTVFAAITLPLTVILSNQWI